MSSIKEHDKLLPREKVLRDPIHSYIYIQSQIILDLINTKEFQRLRRIRQLGTASSTFHGAEHSRFTHSVGVYEIARQICDTFARNYPTSQPNDGLWDDRERLVALCAALLHDIGHGPYSHTFEHIFQTNHEALTAQILLSPKTEVNQVLRQVSPVFPQKVASVIQKTYPNPQVVQMISSQIDADRMDYLLRDSYFTGTNYGTFDLRRILRMMRPYRNGITFHVSGMHAVEDYIISRFQMYQQVYFHPVSRSMEVILNHLLLRAKLLYQSSHWDKDRLPQMLLPFFAGKFSLLDYLKLDDNILNTYFTIWCDDPDPILSDLARRFLNRKPFKSVCYAEQTKKVLPQLKSLVHQAGFDATYYTATNNSYDLPYDAYEPGQKQQAAQIKLMRDDGSLVELSTVSKLVKAITGKFLGDERFFFPKEMLLGQGPTFQEFRSYLKNGWIKNPTK
ncbi:hydrolase [Liquorilactobacillus vini DSM 20605]|uniref:Hydrolase n=1 Tax=Liquorilactobacillus vini DSM 20605 TaxID=1133569 RepID=A0A0R2CFV1_9LACO|nr:hydrolase [Liquorilactobacillus vini DSM 20605]